MQVLWPDRSEPGQPQNSAAPMLGKREGVQQRGGQTAEAAWADADAEEPRHKTLGRQDVLGLCLGAVSPAGAQNWSGEKAVLPRQLPSLVTSCEAAEFSAPTAYCRCPGPTHATPRHARQLSSNRLPPPCAGRPPGHDGPRLGPVSFLAVGGLLPGLHGRHGGAGALEPAGRRPGPPPLVARSCGRAAAAGGVLPPTQQVRGAGEEGWAAMLCAAGARAGSTGGRRVSGRPPASARGHAGRRQGACTWRGAAAVGRN